MPDCCALIVSGAGFFPAPDLACVFGAGPRAVRTAATYLSPTAVLCDAPGAEGAAREAAAREKAAARQVFEDVRTLREQFAADHALLQLMLSRFAPP